MQHLRKCDVNVQEAETAQAPHVEYTVDYLSSTGEYSRWPIAQHPFRLSVNYGNRLLQKPKRPEFTITLGPDSQRAQPFSLSPYTIDHLHARPLSFVTKPLSVSLAMVGSAFLHLSIAVKDCNEVSMFAYIEDLDVASGYSHYVTEGKVPVLFNGYIFIILICHCGRCCAALTCFFFSRVAQKLFFSAAGTTHYRSPVICILYGKPYLLYAFCCCVLWVQIMASHRPSQLVEDLPIGAYSRLKRTFFRKDHKPVNGKKRNPSQLSLILLAA